MLISIKDLNDVKMKTISREDKWRTTWVMYLCARSVDLTSFYDCNVGFDNCCDTDIFSFFLWSRVNCNGDTNHIKKSE